MADLFSIVVLGFNKREYTERCLESLLSGACAPTQLEFIFVNNGSSDDTAEWAAQFKTQCENKNIPFRVITLQPNKGVAAGFNAGINAASEKSRWIALISNDTWLMPGWDKAMLDAIQKTGVSMLSPSYDEGPFVAALMSSKAATWVQKNQGRTKKRWGSIFMMFEREVFKKIGLWDESYFCTSEDADFRHRMRIAGLTYSMTGNCYCWHQSKGTRGEDPKNNQYEIDGRNIFKKKWGFDPIEPEHQFKEKLKRRWDRFCKKLGYL